MIFNSPDETSNYYFTKMFAEEGALRITEPLNEMLNYNLHPRSVKVNGNDLVPGSFLGMILIYGSIAKVFGSWAIVFLTPLITSATALFLYGLLRRIFSDRVAFFSSLLFLFHPAVWYFSSRGMFHNMLFADLLVISLYFIVRISYKPSMNRYVTLGRMIGIGLLMGAALMVRTSEAVWMGLVGLAVVIAFFKMIKLRDLAIVLVVILLCGAPIIFIDQTIYGDYLKTGYSKLDTSAVAVEVPREQIKNDFSNEHVISKALRPIFTFGIRPRTAWANFDSYYLKMFWWLTVLLAAGSALFVGDWSKRGKEEKLFFLVFYGMAIYMGLYYGSWKVHDNINSSVTINNSYVRYWLPLYVFALPFIALVFDRLWAVLGKRKTAILFAFLAVCFFLSARAVYIRDEDGLSNVRSSIREYQSVFKEVSEVADKGSIIITSRSDKIFFPDRRVMVGIYESIPFLPNVVGNVNIYYYEYLRDEDVEYLNDKKLWDLGLEMREIKTLQNGFRLFKIEKIGNNKLAVL